MPTNKARGAEIPFAQFHEKLKDQRRSLGHLVFRNRQDRNFSKWESLTENIVISCFGQKSNQQSQFDLLVRKLVDDSKFIQPFDEYSIKPADFKTKMKDLLTNFISEVEINMRAQPSFATGQRSTRISMTNTQIAIQKVDVRQTVQSILQNIRETEPNQERVKEAEQNLNEFQEEIQKDSPQWANLKRILAWLLEFSRDAFLRVIPILVDKYLKGER